MGHTTHLRGKANTLRMHTTISLAIPYWLPKQENIFNALLTLITDNKSHNISKQTKGLRVFSHATS